MKCTFDEFISNGCPHCKKRDVRVWRMVMRNRTSTDASRILVVKCFSCEKSYTIQKFVDKSETKPRTREACCSDFSIGW